MSEIVITQRDQGGLFDVHRGDVIVFRLEENLTTGYGWEMEAIDGSAVELLESAYDEAPGTALGRGGTRTVRLAARLPGNEEVRLKLRRPWEPPDRALARLGVTIRVR